MPPVCWMPAIATTRGAGLLPKKCSSSSECLADEDKENYLTRKKRYGMKRILSLLLVAVFCLAAAACSKPSVTPPEEPGSSETATEPSWDTTTDTEITANTGMEESAISSDTSATTVPTTRASDRDYDGGGGQEYDVLDRRDLPPSETTDPTETPKPSYAPVVEDPADCHTRQIFRPA